MRVLLLGAGGMLGSDLAALAPRNVELTPRSRAQLDVRDDRAVAEALDTVQPDVVVNASGYTAVDLAESERAAAFAINATAVGKLGTACASRQVDVVHFSTDYVFDGRSSSPYREDDRPSPLNSYGASKLAGEEALFASGARALVIRAQWLFGTRGASFPSSMLERARRRAPTRVVDDQRGRPTYTIDLGRATWQLVSLGTIGLVHVAASETATWFELASRVFAHEGASELVTPCRTDEFPRPARRPAYSVLDTARAERLLGAALPPWQDGLSRFLGALEATGAGAPHPHEGYR